MDIKQLIHDDDAVSPVIGVILMVAITVILAAVIASFVLGLGDQAQQATPQASFSFDYESDSTYAGDGNVTITHDGGDTIEAGELYIRGEFGSSDDSPGNWTTFPGTDANAGSEITAGNSIDPNVESNYELSVVYEPAEGDTSATLAQDTGPDA
ncbi:type IV pilin [Haloarcula rubripromontorii]|uniref:Type IV pilin n=1 Tax=Haloarcula rubripromontorii TaxID=1705562 RepID=A0A847U937_9EURY|nr:type IV pilin N-terminal domain-containing protein [Haloarcula rubripromontorii]NLV07331.1 type IV pilin [Haloarcula rubripromontorii]